MVRAEIEERAGGAWDFVVQINVTFWFVTLRLYCKELSILVWIFEKTDLFLIWIFKIFSVILPHIFKILVVFRIKS